jgi:hypothetical protein
MAKEGGQESEDKHELGRHLRITPAHAPLNGFLQQGGHAFGAAVILSIHLRVAEGKILRCRTRQGGNQSALAVLKPQQMHGRGSPSRQKQRGRRRTGKNGGRWRSCGREKTECTHKKGCR